MFTLLLGIFAGLPALSIDLSAPTLTILPSVLHSTAFIAGLTLSLFMVGFGIGQFFGGRLSDRIGRRKVLLVSLGVYVFGALCCTLATSGSVLVATRFVQGVGAGGCAVQASAIVQDLFSGEVARRKQSLVTVVIAIMPMVAPAIGALMLSTIGWRSVHFILAAFGAILFVVVAVSFTESRTPPAKPITGFGVTAGLGMLRERWFLRIALTNALSYAAVFSYIAGAPVIVMNTMGYSTFIYAALFASTALALTLGAYTNAVLGRRGFGTLPLIRSALFTQAAANIILALASGRTKELQVAMALPAVVMCCFSRGIASPNMIYLGVSGHRENAGLASAMIGLLQLSAGAAASAVVAALLPRWGFASAAVPMAVLATLSVLCWRFTGRLDEGAV